MTLTDFQSLAPFLVIAIAPVIIMLTISVIRNFEVVFGFSVLFLLLALAAVLYVIPVVPHVIDPLFLIDRFSLFFLGLILLGALLVTLLSYNYFKHLRGVREEYYILLFISTLGASLLVVARHFVSFFLGIETLSVTLYVLIAFQRTHEGSIESGIKYLVLASVSSAFLLFGMALIYLVTGTMKFGEMATMLGSAELSPVVVAGFAMMLVGIGFKLAVVPFHMWTPDVYQGAPAPVGAFIATVSKGAVLAVLIRFFMAIGGSGNHLLFIVISAIAILSMFTGNLLALRQKNLKRLLGYSSIANMGYVTIILLTGTNAGMQAAIFYLAAYFVTTIGAFGVISALSTSQYEAERISDYRGLFWKKPGVSILFTLALLSLAGIPLTAGFISKFYVVLEGMKAGLMVLVFSLIINSVIGLYYYLRVITTLFSPADQRELPAVSWLGRITLGIIGVSILLLGIFPGWLIELITRWAVL